MSVASSKRGNHASGAASSRPSASTTRSWTCVTLTSTAVASNLTAEVGIPCLQELQSMLDHQRPQTLQVMSPKAVRLRDADRVEPELCHVVTMLDMNVR